MKFCCCWEVFYKKPFSNAKCKAPEGCVARSPWQSMVNVGVRCQQRTGGVSCSTPLSEAAFGWDGHGLIPPQSASTAPGTSVQRRHRYIPVYMVNVPWTYTPPAEALQGLWPGGDGHQDATWPLPVPAEPALLR